jgi:hypothetical protein
MIIATFGDAPAINENGCQGEQYAESFHDVGGSQSLRPLRFSNACRMKISVDCLTPALERKNEKAAL